MKKDAMRLAPLAIIQAWNVIPVMVLKTGSYPIISVCAYLASFN